MASTAEMLMTLTRSGCERVAIIAITARVVLRSQKSRCNDSTAFGELKLIAAPAGVPRGYDALRAGATREHLGSGLRPEIASTGDLIAMFAALRRNEDLKRMPALRRILELEADPAGIVTPKPPPQMHPGGALEGELSFAERSRRSGPGAGPALGR
jgi:hypothetical protein